MTRTRIQNRSFTRNWYTEKENRRRQHRARNSTKNRAVTKYNICKSVNQWATDCPDINFLEVTCLASEIVLHQTNDELKSLVSETWSAAFLELAQQSVDWTEMV